MADIPSLSRSSEIRTALGEIVAEYGEEALSNAKTMTSLLKDLLPDSPGAAQVLVAAAEEQLAAALRNHVEQGMDPRTATALVASSFSSKTMFAADVCAWVAGELAAAIGVAAADASPPHLATPSRLPKPEQAGPAVGAQVAPAGSAGTTSPKMTVRRRRRHVAWLVPMVSLIVGAGGFVLGHNMADRVTVVRTRTVTHTVTHTVRRTVTHRITRTVHGAPGMPCAVAAGLPYPPGSGTFTNKTTCTATWFVPTPAVKGTELVLTTPAGTSNAWTLVQAGS